MFEKLMRKSFVIELVEKMQNRDSWTGETHIQKSIYFLQEFFSIPIGYEFILYKHGPFSFDLRDELTEMKVNNFLKVVPQEPYGASFYPGIYAETIKRNSDEQIQDYNERMNFVVKRISNNSVRKLERWATALYVRKNEKIRDDKEAIEKITELKPHISEKQAKEALEKLTEFEVESKERGLI